MTVPSLVSNAVEDWFDAFRALGSDVADFSGLTFPLDGYPLEDIRVIASWSREAVEWLMDPGASAPVAPDEALPLAIFGIMLESQNPFLFEEYPGCISQRDTLPRQFAEFVEDELKRGAVSERLRPLAEYFFSAYEREIREQRETNRANLEHHWRRVSWLRKHQAR